MSEDPKQLPGEPEASGSQEQPEATEPVAAPQPFEQVQYPPVPEMYVQPVAPTLAAQPQYPPTPESYAQQQQAIQNPYAAPNVPATPANPYAVTPADNTVPPVGYPVPPAGYGYGAPGFPPQPPYGYGYAQVPQAQPLPLGQAIRELPGQYKRVLLKPGAATFAAEQGKAEWGIIWIQILILALLEVVVAIPTVVFGSQSSNTAVLAPGFPPGFFSAVLQFEAIFLVVLTPALFLAGVGIQYLFAKMFKGQGLFKQQAYNSLLYQVPFAVISTALSVIVSPLTRQMSTNIFNLMSTTTTSSSLFSPGVTLVLLLLDVVSLAILVYSIVLNVHAIMAAHRMSGGKASGVVLIPYGILVVIALLAICGLAVLLASVAAGAAQ